MSHPVVIHADLGPAARAAFGRWVAAVYWWVAHIDACPFGCTAERTACSDGGAAVDDEQARWQSWRTANIAPSADGTTSWRDVRAEGAPC